MFGGLNGIGRLLGLLVSLARKFMRARSERRAQESYEAVESDPAGEFARRYGVRGDEERSGSDAPQAQAGKPEEER